jgi:hypothetical protein
MSLHHDPYKVPYEPPPWNEKGKPDFMLFNDDEKREYYEGIPVPGTEEFFAMTNEEQARAKHERNRGMERAKELEKPQSKQQQDDKLATHPLGKDEAICLFSSYEHS